MLHTPGLIGSFAAGMNIPEQFFTSRARLKQAHENLLRSQILDQYLPQHQKDLIQHAADAHLIQHQNLMKLQALLPYQGPQAAANLQKTRIGSTLAAPKLQIGAQNAASRRAAIEQSKSRFSRAAYQARQFASAYPMAAKNVLAAHGGAINVLKTLQNLNVQALHQSQPQTAGGGAPGVGAQQMAPPIQIPTQTLPLPLLGPGGQVQGSLPPTPFPGGAPVAPPQLGAQGLINAPTQGQAPAPMPTGQPGLPGGAPQQPPIPTGGQLPPPGAPQGAQGVTGQPTLAPGTLSPANMQEAAKQTMDQQRVAQNYKATTRSMWTRWQSGVALDKFISDPGNREIFRSAAKFAGLKGGLKRFVTAINDPNSKEFVQFQEFKHALNQNIGNSIRMMEGSGVTPYQMKELKGIFDSVTGASNMLTTNPKAALERMNESGRELHVLTKSLEGPTHTFFPPIHALPDWTPITSKQPTLTFKTKDEFQNWMKTASQSQIRAEIAKLKG